FVDPLNPSTSDRIVTMTWTPIRLVHDNSTRPCFTPANVPCSTLGGATGVGVLDQGPLAHYVIEKATLNAGTSSCLNDWTAAGPAVDHPANTTNATVPPNTCVRLKTSFGRTPSASMGPTGATNWDNAVRGKLGDIGYNVVSGARKIG